MAPEPAEDRTAVVLEHAAAFKELVLDLKVFVLELKELVLDLTGFVLPLKVFVLDLTLLILLGTSRGIPRLLMTGGAEMIGGPSFRTPLLLTVPALLLSALL